MLLCAALAALTLVGCSDDQTTFNISKVPGHATVKGTIVFNQGTQIVDGKFVYDYKPAANLPVYVTVNNSSYSDALEGTTILTTYTDENGAYSIDIPASESSMEITIRTADFEGVHTFVEVQNGKPYQKQENVIYRGYGQETIRDHAIRFCDIECTVNDTEEEFKGFTQYATLTGTIGKNAEYYVPAQRVYDEETSSFIGYKNATVYNVWEPASTVDLIIKVSYPNSSKTVTYNATTAANGSFSLQVPVSGFPAEFSYQVEALSYDGTYTHYEPIEKEYTLPGWEERTFTYVDYQAKTIKGWYEQMYGISGRENYPTSSVVRTFSSKTLVFNATPEALDGSTYNPNAFGQSTMWLSELLEMLAEQEK